MKEVANAVSKPCVGSVIFPLSTGDDDADFLYDAAAVAVAAATAPSSILSLVVFCFLLCTNNCINRQKEKHQSHFIYE